MQPYASIVPVILCGGAGARLWPYSSNEKPKQFLAFASEQTMLQETISRIADEFDDIVIVTLAAWQEEVEAQIAALALPNKFHCLYEPEGKGTLPAMALAAFYIKAQFAEGTLGWFMPCDHKIEQPAHLLLAVNAAIADAQNDRHMVFGIKPEGPQTAFGYIECAPSSSHVLPVVRFAEKPTQTEAEFLLQNALVYWSSGMHLTKIESFLRHVEYWAPASYLAVKKASLENVVYPDKKIYGALEEAAFEKHVLPHIPGLAMVEMQGGWSDIGRWKSVWETSGKDKDGNVLQGDILCDNVQDSLIYAGKRKIACVGMRNVVVVDTDEEILIADLNTAEGLRAFKNKRHVG